MASLALDDGTRYQAHGETVRDLPDAKTMADIQERLARQYKPCRCLWGCCPDSSDDGGLSGEPHECFYNKGHHDDHTCGTCEARLPLSEDEQSSLEQP